MAMFSSASRSMRWAAALATSSAGLYLYDQQTPAMCAEKAKGKHDANAKVLVINSGSSSLKFKLFQLEPFQPLMSGLVERIGDVKNSRMVVKTEDGTDKKWEVEAKAKDHSSALGTMIKFLKDHGYPTIDTEVKAVGHRVVHGGNIHDPVLVDEASVAELQRAAVLAPLHNPPALAGIDAGEKVFGKNVPQVIVVDTAYHTAGMPEHAYMYGLPYDLSIKHSIRRYGFHGTSHHYVAEQAAEMLGKPLEKLNAISCHLGNGSSVCAIRHGKSVDTSMGLTPQEGLMMGTRCGDIDSTAPLFLMNKEGLTPAQMDNMLNKQSGLLGIAGNNDLRTVIAQANGGDKKSQLALNMFCYKIRKYIGSYSAVLGGEVDCIIFTAGIGENAAIVREQVCKDMEAFGVKLDHQKNKKAFGGQQMEISAPGSRIKVFVIPTDEEGSIAHQTIEVVGL